MKGNELRQKFLDYFEGLGHKQMPSSSLIPNDPTVLLTLAGMLQFKPIFLGDEKAKNKRVTTCQKCMRMIDVQNVGKTPRHHTFFEMLGNFSFGDYFKKEAIWWAWEFLVKKLDLDRSRLHIAVYEKDDESFEIWEKLIGIPRKRIYRLGEDNNFWSAGPTGPCGPCSEIYWDTGEKFGCGKPNCGPGCDCDRFLELWNLVFIEFNRDASGKLNKLPSKNIDTGMGLERIASVMQGVTSNFDTDLIRPIVDEVVRVSGGKCGKDRYPCNVIADHIRAITHLVSDGVMPSNEGRGYVLRRLIRRAARFGKNLGIKGMFLNKLSAKVVSIMGEAYPELKKNADRISSVILAEEESFNQTLESGLAELNAIMKIRASDKLIGGQDAFKLHDTFGFPLELVSEIAKESGFSVDLDGFEREMAKQKDRARSAGLKKTKAVADPVKLASIPSTKFVGYEALQSESKVLAVFPEEKLIVLDKTSFYPEGGGQVGDEGSLQYDHKEIKVISTAGRLGGVILHEVQDMSAIKPKMQVRASVDAGKRFHIANHHTSTHLLHKALRMVLGEQATQTGSFVSPDYFRFDFHSSRPLTDEEISRIEDIVNIKIRENINVEVIETSVDEAKKLGAMALFDEKYGKKVRVIKIGDWSLELCAGTHVKNTGLIELFKITGESALAAGVRRIEAISGSKVIENVLSKVEELRTQNLELICAFKDEEFKKEQLGGDPLTDFDVFEIPIEEVANIKKALREKDLTNVGKFLNHLTERNERLKQRIESIKKETAKLSFRKMDEESPALISSALGIKGVKVISGNFNDMGRDELRSLCDKISSQTASAAMIFGSVSDGRPLLVCSLTDDLVAKGLDASRVVKEAAKLISGGGGGKPKIADAGGRDPSKLPDAIAFGLEMLKQLIGEKL